MGHRSEVFIGCVDMKFQIDSYEFGRMMVGGKDFASDLIIYPDGDIYDNWWRQQGHNLVPDDIGGLLETRPRILIIGTGAYGRMNVSTELIEVCRENGIKLDILPTADAVTSFNKAVNEGAVVAGCFHLTC
ncbi:MAG: MTH938/NDUFAF3 family protein [Verrucomicrobia bacterium]|nr:MTH938/NDUFAF3 family protein [Verrucomicrobiota bacterium]MCF7708131.1 MTH938/NDUFAF3 family protein [Verrucomicrobiota bacterium]